LKRLIPLFSTQKPCSFSLPEITVDRFPEPEDINEWAAEMASGEKVSRPAGFFKSWDAPSCMTNLSAFPARAV